MMITRRHFMGGSTSLLLAAALPGRSQADPPTAGNRLIFGYPQGAVGSKLAEGLLPLLAAQGVPSYHLQILDGRNTRLASEAAARATADGSTLLQAVSTSLTLLPSVYKDVRFDPAHDFRPLACVGEFPYALAVGPLVPASVTRLSQYLAWVADNPEFRNIGVSVYGTLGHLAVRTLTAATEAPLRAQPYQGTTGVMADLHSQSLAAAFVAPGAGIGIGAGAQVRAIGVTSRERLMYWPELPTLAEQGVAGMDFTGWFGWFTQAATPAAKAQPLREAIVRMQALPAYDDILKQLLLIPVKLDPTQLIARMREETLRYKALVDGFHISKFD